MNKDKYFKYQWRYQKEDFKFCPRCGSNLALEDLHIENQPQLICHSCEFVFYLDPKLVVVALVIFENKVLLLQRAEEPGVGKWGLPGGHVQRGDDLFTTIVNEVKEETGLTVSVGSIIKIYSFKESGLIQIVFEAKAETELVRVNIESFEGKFFTIDEIPWDKLAFETTRETLNNYFKTDI